MVLSVAVAGSTSLALLMVRLIVSHVLMPALAPKSGEQSELKKAHDSGPNPADFELVQYIVKGLKVFDTLASIFSTCWLIAGSIYVYGVSPTYDEPTSSSYCDESAYKFAFSVITIGYISLALSVVAAICSCFCRGDDDSEA